MPLKHYSIVRSPQSAGICCRPLVFLARIGVHGLNLGKSGTREPKSNPVTLRNAGEMKERRT